jgi:small GTP-binding protein
MANDENNVIKMIIIGESGVGKTNLTNVYDNGRFTEKTNSTFLSSYISKILKIGQIEFEIQLWDTPGQEQYRSITKLFYREAKISIIVYDITNRTTFESLDYWVGSVKEILGDESMIAIVGNKIDLFEKEEINQNEGKQYAKKIGASFYLSSAKKDVSGFYKFIADLIAAYTERNNLESIKDKKVILNSKSSKKKERRNVNSLFLMSIN